MQTIVDKTVAARVYPLNKSRSKFAVVGVTYQDSDDWSAEVVLCGQYWVGVRMTVREWQTVVKNADRIRSYMHGGPCDPEIPISQYFKIYLKEAYNVRCVVFETTDGKFLVYFKRF